MVNNSGQWEKIQKSIIDKVRLQADKYGCDFPDLVMDNRHFVLSKADSWISGFWPGILLKVYKYTEDADILHIVREYEKKQNEVFGTPLLLHHDVGFMWYLSSATDYNLTGNEQAKENALNAAFYLMSRFNPKGNFLQSWNNDSNNNVSKIGWAIIDSMMNIELLYWASIVTGDPRFKNVANSHADSTMKNFIRDDGTVKHIVKYDPETGKVTGSMAGQGYSEDSSWTRGMGWAAYGFVKAYTYTGNKEYLETSERVVNKFFELLPENVIPPCDFMQPADAGYYDSSAGALIVCAALELAALETGKREYYFDNAVKLLNVLTDKCLDLDPENEGFLRLSTQAYSKGWKNITVIYGDYYYIEAVDKLLELMSKLTEER